MNRASDKEWESDMRWWDTRRKEWTTNRVSHVTLYPIPAEPGSPRPRHFAPRGEPASGGYGYKKRIRKTK